MKSTTCGMMRKPQKVKRGAQAAGRHGPPTNEIAADGCWLPWQPAHLHDISCNHRTNALLCQSLILLFNTAVLAPNPSYQPFSFSVSMWNRCSGVLLMELFLFRLTHQCVSKASQHVLYHLKIIWLKWGDCHGRRTQDTNAGSFRSKRFIINKAQQSSARQVEDLLTEQNKSCESPKRSPQ